MQSYCTAGADLVAFIDWDHLAVAVQKEADAQSRWPRYLFRAADTGHLGGTQAAADPASKVAKGA